MTGMVRRCSFCAVDWPDEPEFEHCRNEGCGRATWRVWGQQLNDDEPRIASARNHIAFEKFCAEKDAADYAAALPFLQHEIAALEDS